MRMHLEVESRWILQQGSIVECVPVPEDRRVECLCRQDVRWPGLVYRGGRWRGRILSSGVGPFNLNWLNISGPPLLTRIIKTLEYMPKDPRVGTAGNVPESICCIPDLCEEIRGVEEIGQKSNDLEKEDRCGRKRDVNLPLDQSTEHVRCTHSPT
jgi:hypothetical protein